MTLTSFVNQRSLLHDPVRLGILVAIAARNEPIDFMTVATALNLSRGNLSSHARKLEEAGYIAVHKEFVDRKPRTTFTCTNEGKDGLNAYLESLEQFLNLAKKA